MISDLQAMTETQLKTLSAAQLVDHIMQERSTSVVVKQVGDSRGMLEYVVETRDYKGNLTGIEETHTTYKADGSVDVITKVEKDEKGAEKARKEIAHDGTRAWVKSEVKAGKLAVSKSAETPVKTTAALPAAPKEDVSAVPGTAAKKGVLQAIKTKLVGLVRRS
jgi:hypothetical protein